MAYQEFLRANGINPEDLSQKEYSDLLNTQDMYNDDLIHFSKSENCKDVGTFLQAGPAGRSPREHRAAPLWKGGRDRGEECGIGRALLRAQAHPWLLTHETVLLKTAVEGIAHEAQHPLLRAVLG